MARYEYRTVETRTLKGLKQAERLHQSEKWEQVNVRLFSTMYRRLKPPHRKVEVKS